MAIKGEKKWERNFRWAVHIVGGIAFPLVFILFGFVFKQPCDIDKVYLWCNLHPFSVMDFIGCLLFFAGCIGLSGIWSVFTGDLDEDPGKQIMWLSGLGAIAGVVIVWFL